MTGSPLDSDKEKLARGDRGGRMTGSPLDSDKENSRWVTAAGG